MIKEFKFLRKNNPTHSVQLSPECYLPEYYDTTNTIFSHVSTRHWCPYTYHEFKYMVYKQRNGFEHDLRHRIGPDHPMYNFNETR